MFILCLNSFILNHVLHPPQSTRTFLPVFATLWKKIAALPVYAWAWHRLGGADQLTLPWDLWSGGQAGPLVAYSRKIPLILIPNVGTSMLLTTIWILTQIKALLNQNSNQIQFQTQVSEF